MNRRAFVHACARPTLAALLCAIVALGCAPPTTAASVSAPQATAIKDTRPLCIYISSYHAGYSWSDRLGGALRKRLGERCEIVQYDMDTKRRRAESDVVAAAAEALALIERLDPDVIITSDDNAAKYLIVPELANGAWPVVFSGINWTVEEYGLPVDNVTGMVEMPPVRAMFRQTGRTVPDARRAAWIGLGTLTGRKNFSRMVQSARLDGIEVVPFFVSTFADWKDAFAQAQEEDFVILGNVTGLADWDIDAAAAHAGAITRKLSVTLFDWMMPVAILGYTHLPEEQGDWAGASALAILDGVKPASIPLVTNRDWDTWLNDGLRRSSGVQLPKHVIRKSKRTD